jgi:hypothetical protein
MSFIVDLMNEPTSSVNFVLHPDFAALVARERHSDLLRESAQRRLARQARINGERSRRRFLRWR